METKEIDLKLESVVVKGRSMPLPTIKQLNKRFPRKLKKKLKFEKGSDGFKE